METAEIALPTSEIHVWVVYLTARCNFNCSYCIQKEVMTPDRPRKPWLRYRELSGREWVEALNALPVRPAHTLILTANVVAVRQWIREIIDKTSLREDQVAEYTGDSKNIAPVTVATYQIVTYRKRKSDEFPHFEIFNKGDWGLIVYDEVHLLPAFQNLQRAEGFEVPAQ